MATPPTPPRPPTPPPSPPGGPPPPRTLTDITTLLREMNAGQQNEVEETRSAVKKALIEAIKVQQTGSKAERVANIQSMKMVRLEISRLGNDLGGERQELLDAYEDSIKQSEKSNGYLKLISQDVTDRAVVNPMKTLAGFTKGLTGELNPFVSLGINVMKDFKAYAKNLKDADNLRREKALQEIADRLREAGGAGGPTPPPTPQPPTPPNPLPGDPNPPPAPPTPPPAPGQPPAPIVNVVINNPPQPAPIINITVNPTPVIINMPGQPTPIPGQPTPIPPPTPPIPGQPNPPQPLPPALPPTPLPIPDSPPSPIPGPGPSPGPAPSPVDATIVDRLTNIISTQTSTVTSGLTKISDAVDGGTVTLLDIQSILARVGGPATPLERSQPQESTTPVKITSASGGSSMDPSLLMLRSIYAILGTLTGQMNVLIRFQMQAIEEAAKNKLQAIEDQRLGGSPRLPRPPTPQPADQAQEKGWLSKIVGPFLTAMMGGAAGGGIVATLVAMAKNIGAGIKTGLGGFVKGIQSAFSTVIEIGGKATKMLSGAGALLKKGLKFIPVVGQIAMFLEAVWDFGQGFVKAGDILGKSEDMLTVWDRISSGLGSILGTFGGLADWVVSLFGFETDLKGFITKGVATFLSEIPTKIKGLFEDSLASVKTFMGSFGSSFVDNLKIMAELALKSMLMLMPGGAAVIGALKLFEGNKPPTATPAPVQAPVPVSNPAIGTIKPNVDIASRSEAGKFGMKADSNTREIDKLKQEKSKPAAAPVVLQTANVNNSKVNNTYNSTPLDTRNRDDSHRKGL